MALLLVVPSRSVSAQVPREYRVEAVLEVEQSRLDVMEEIDVVIENGQSELTLWVYGERLTRAPRAMDEISWRWIFPGDEEHGGVDIREVRLDGRRVQPTRSEDLRAIDRKGVDLTLRLEPGPSRVLHIELRFQMHIPSRFGRLGRDGSTFSFTAPWYVLVAHPSDQAYDFDAVHHVHMRTSAGELLCGSEEAPSSTCDVTESGPYVPVLAAPSFDEWRSEVAGVPVVWHSFEDLGRPPDRHDRTIGALADPLQIDRVGVAEPALRAVLSTRRWLGLVSDRPLHLVTVPSRTELCANAPGWVLVSDRWAQVTPVDFLREFPLRALRHAAFLQQSEVANRQLEEPADRGWANDVRAAVFEELDQVRRGHSNMRAEDLLSSFAFHPSIDQLLYAPQVAFDAAYFGVSDDVDRWGDDPTRARVRHAAGSRIVESARDVLSPDRLRSWMNAVARRPHSVRAALARVDAQLATRIDEWLAHPRLPVNYRLGAIRSRQTAPGFVHEVEIIREGGPRTEPVEIVLEDSDGVRHSRTWSGEGERGTVVFETRSGRRGVTLDPSHRRAQSAALTEGHPRRDDTTDLPFRPPIFTGFVVDVLATEGNVTGLVDAVIRQRYDLEHTIGFRALRTAARTGGRVRYTQSFGPKIHQNRRSMALGGGAGFYYVQPGFGGTVQGGYAIDADVGLTLDTRLFPYDWREGSTLALSLELRTTVREDGHVGASGRFIARASHTIPFGVRNALVFVGNAGATVEPVLEADLQSMGGRTGLRGFANDELLGRGALYAVAEHRVTVVTDLALNVFHLIWARELQFVWWGGVGALLEAADGTDAVFAGEVGIGARLHYEYAGVQPGVLALDLGAPLTRWAQRSPCAFTRSASCDSQIPFGFYVSVEQYY